MGLISDLQQHYYQLLGAGQHALSNVGQAVSNEVHQLPQQVNTVAQAPNILQGFGNTLSSSLHLPGNNINPSQIALQHVVSPYIQNNIVKPIQQGIPKVLNPNSTLVDRAEGLLSAGGGVSSATPYGMGFNALYGGAAGALKGIRTKSDIPSSILSGLTTPSDIGGTGLGIKNPITAGAIDLLTGNPKAVLKSGKAITGLAKGLKSVEGALPDAIAQRVPQLAQKANNQGLNIDDVHEVMQYAKQHLDIPVKTLSKMTPQQMLQELGGLLDKNQGYAYRDLPGLGLVSKKAQQQLPSEVQLPEQPSTLPQGISSDVSSLGTSKQPTQGQLLENQALDNSSSSSIPQPVNISSEAVKGSIKASRIPTQTEIKNRAELAAGNPDLYTQRAAKIEKAFGKQATGQPTAQEMAATQDFEKNVLGSQEATPKIELSNNQRAIDEASLTGGSAGNVAEDVKQGFANWVNNIHAKGIEGLKVAQNYTSLDSKGLDALHEYQAGNRTGVYKNIQDLMDTMQKQEKDAGIPVNYKHDYLYQLWKEPQATVDEVMQRVLSKNPGFSKESVFKTYQAGIDAELTPKYTKMSQIIMARVMAHEKAMADVTYFKELATKGLIQPSNQAPRDWVSLNPDSFPKYSVNIGNGTYSGVYKAPPGLAKMINNYLGTPHEGLNKFANFTSRAKNVTLSFGIPKTAINIHGINILARHTLFGQGSNPITRFATAGKYLLHPNSAEASLSHDLEGASDAVRHGLTISGEEHTALLTESESVAKSLGKNWNNLFEAPLFNKMIPALKLSSYKELVKNGMKEEDAAKVINNVYGGINWEQMGRNRTTQDMLRAFFLAPDWAEGNVRLGKNLAQSLTPFGDKATAGTYRRMTATFLASYVALNAANKLTSGHYAYQNDPGHEFELESGYTNDGQKRYIKPYGTAVDFFRLPFQVAAGLAKGDPTQAFSLIRNRLSTPAGAIAGLTFNTDYKGDHIYGNDKYGNPLTTAQQIGGVGSQVLSGVGFPSFAQNAVDYATGKQGPEEALTQGLELPTHYSNIGHSKVAQQLAPYENLQGKQLYDFNNSLKGQNKLTDKQIQGVNSSQDKPGAIQNILQVRKIKSDLNTQKKALLNNQQADSGNQAFAAENSKIIDGKVYYVDNGSVKTIDLNPPTKGTAGTIGSFSNSNWQANKAADVWNSSAPQDVKNQALKQLGVSPDDARYAALTKYSSDVSTQYIISKSPDRQTLINNLLTGRVVSNTGQQFADNTVIDNLYNQGYLSKSDATQLKKIKVDKQGNSLAKATGTGGGKKVKAIKIPKIKAPKLVKLPKPKKVKQYTLKAPKLSTKVTKVKKLTLS